MLTNNSMSKQAIPKIEKCIQTLDFVMDEESDSDQSTASWSSDESFSDSDYDSADFDDTNMFDEVVAVAESIKNAAPRVRMPGTHGSGGDLHLMGSQQAALRDIMIRRNSYNEKQMGAGIKMAIQTTMKPTETKQDNFGDHLMVDNDPKVVLKSILESHGASSEPRPYDSLEGFFVTMTEAMVAAYDMETVSAIRKGVLDDVRELHKAGKNLVACNQFGESIIHLACRHGKTDIVEFLMFQAGTSPRVVCDSGRTPMHDACWTAAPNFECIRLVLEEVPDLLLIADKRGHTPLAYLPRDTWGEWSAFLTENRDILVPKYLR
jgi:hypothetical protein